MNEDSKGCTLDVCYSHVPLGEAEGINSNQGNPQKIGVEDKNENPQKIGVQNKKENPQKIGVEEKIENPQKIGEEENYDENSEFLVCLSVY